MEYPVSVDRIIDELAALSPEERRAVLAAAERMDDRQAGDALAVEADSSAVQRTAGELMRRFAAAMRKLAGS